MRKSVIYIWLAIIAFFMLGYMVARVNGNAKDLGAIWFIGDSLIQGNADADDQGSPRKALYDLLKANDYQFSYTGHHAKNVDGLPAVAAGVLATDNLYHYHSGVSGILIGDEKHHGLYNLLEKSWDQGRLATVKPEIILIMLGTNDVDRGHKLDNAPNRIRALLDKIYTLPDIGSPKIFLASVPPNHRSEANKGNVLIFNESIQQIVNEYEAKGRYIYFVDNFTPINHAYNENMRKDNLHPNGVGNKTMAQQWFKAIEDSRTSTQGSLVAEPSEQVFPGEKTDFHGFDSYKFRAETGNISIQIIVPKKAASGKPWLWRSLFWTALPKVWKADLQLVEEGYHVVIVHGDVSGHPRGNKSIDMAYELFTEEYGFAKTCSMASFSRGTLSLFRWAATNPDKVNSIYVDNGVCNILSWPAGKLVPGNDSIANGAPSSWELFKKTFGFETDAEALKSKESPIDQLEPLAKAGVPILLVGGSKDKAVPYEENEAILEKRYKKLGGTVKVIIEDKGHSHGMNDPTPILEFIRKYTK